MVIVLPIEILMSECLCQVNAVYSHNLLEGYVVHSCKIKTAADFVAFNVPPMLTFNVVILLALLHLSLDSLWEWCRNLTLISVGLFGYCSHMIVILNVLYVLYDLF